MMKNFDQKIKNYFKENDIIFPYFDNAIVNKSSIFLTKKFYGFGLKQNK